MAKKNIYKFKKDTKKTIKIGSKVKIYSDVQNEIFKYRNKEGIVIEYLPKRDKYSINQYEVKFKNNKSELFKRDEFRVKTS